MGSLTGIRNFVFLRCIFGLNRSCSRRRSLVQRLLFRARPPPGVPAVVGGGATVVAAGEADPRVRRWLPLPAELSSGVGDC